MPCYDGGAPYPPSRDEVLNRKMPAVLCGLVQALGPETVIQAIDWRAAGVTQAEFREWWALHVAEDNRRRQREAEQKRREELRRAAQNKLTPDELDAILGRKT